MKRSTRAFFWVALAWLLVAALLHVLAALGVNNSWGAQIHAMLFGWITTMIIAVNYHTMPVFAARDFPSQRLIWAHWWALLSGQVLALLGLLAAFNALIITGLITECVAALLFVVNIVQLFRRGQPCPPAPKPAIANQPQIDKLGTLATKVSGICLPFAPLLQLGARLGWHGEWVLASEHLTALGWIMLMIVGVAYHVLPRFSGHGVRGIRWAQVQLSCHLGAIVLMVPGLGFGSKIAFALGALLMTSALLLFAWSIWPSLQPFRQRANTIPLVVKERPS